MNATHYKTNGTKETVRLNKKTRLDQLQKLVGGFVEVIYLIKSGEEYLNNGKDLVLNEEGLLFDLPVNPWSAKIAQGTIWEHEEFRGDLVLINGKLS